ncbi:hypothetical protein, partial [Klebsiella pneumoniae]|uniref:hypothetical protein n=1 Tax=Klebsiella pneumoniae TaxID=573 RepID=UPI0025A077B8
EMNIDGLYRIIIQNSTIVHSSGNLGTVETNILSNAILKKNNEKGIINDYIYEVKRIDKNTIVISLLENAKAISHI